MNKDDIDSEKLKESTREDLSDISDSLGKQIRDEMDGPEDQFSEMVEEKKKLSKRKKIAIGVGGGLLLIIVVIILYVSGMLNKINFDNGLNVELQDETFDKDDTSGDQEINPDDVDWANISATTKKEGVINILLVGEEAMADNNRGRSDSVMIATVNKEQKALKLTSIMRDTYVQIPGYSDNKLNAAYKIGGMPLLLETIKLNFNIEMDGYVLVDFSSFETLIDELDGVDITLSADEAHYLNTTNYISKPEYRNVKEGLNTLNGNQALGYSRIRYVKTIDNVRDDFGRTSRQRTVLTALFEKYKSKNLVELISLLNDVLPLVTTNVAKTDIINYLTAALSLGATDLDTLRIPVDNGYTNAKIRTMSVLLPNLPTNVQALHEFIFGESDLTIITNDSSPATDTPVQTATPTEQPTQEPTVEPTLAPTKEPVATETPKPAKTKPPVATVTPVETLEPTLTPTDTPVSTEVPVATTTPTDVPASNNTDSSNAVVLDDNN